MSEQWLTKRKALEICRDMWNWLSNQPGMVKNDWPEWDFNQGFTKMCYHNCACCEYQHQQNNGSMENCKNTCILKSLWPEGCSTPGTPYTLWPMFEGVNSSRYAKQISDAAVKELELLDLKESNKYKFKLEDKVRLTEEVKKYNNMFLIKSVEPGMITKINTSINLNQIDCSYEVTFSNGSVYQVNEDQIELVKDEKISKRKYSYTPFTITKLRPSDKVRIREQFFDKIPNCPIDIGQVHCSSLQSFCDGTSSIMYEVKFPRGYIKYCKLEHLEFAFTFNFKEADHVHPKPLHEHDMNGRLILSGSELLIDNIHCEKKQGVENVESSGDFEIVYEGTIVKSSICVGSRFKFKECDLEFYSEYLDRERKYDEEREKYSSCKSITKVKNDEEKEAVKKSLIHWLENKRIVEEWKKQGVTFSLNNRVLEAPKALNVSKEICIGGGSCALCQYNRSEVFKTVNCNNCILKLNNYECNGNIGPWSKIYQADGNCIQLLEGIDEMIKALDSFLLSSLVNV